jgi:hypothetical protein
VVLRTFCGSIAAVGDSVVGSGTWGALAIDDCVKKVTLPRRLIDKCNDVG